MLQGNVWLELTCMAVALVAGFMFGVLIVSVCVSGARDDERMGRK